MTEGVEEGNRLQKEWGDNLVVQVLAVIVLVVLGFKVMPFLFGGLGLTSRPTGPRNALMLQTRQIGQCLFAWSTDNNAPGNAYPDGASSTEVFQTLVDNGYVNDPMLFYIPMSGKVPPLPGHKLKPENVCFDVTGGVGKDDSDEVPLVFTTGYHGIYAPGAPAIPLAAPGPQYLIVAHSFWFVREPPAPIDPGIAVFYKGNNAMWIKADGAGAIPNFVPPTFAAPGRTFHQLTPGGVLR